MDVPRRFLAAAALEDGLIALTEAGETREHVLLHFGQKCWGW